MVKLTKSELQTVVDYLMVQHDSLFECIVNPMYPDEDLSEYKKDELVLRKFFMSAKEKGISLNNGLYSMDKKIAELSK